MKRGTIRRGFSVIELAIVAAMLGILAALIVPRFQSYSTRAKKAVAKDSLRLLRSAIDLYAAQHEGIPPGYENDDPLTVPTSGTFNDQLAVNQAYLARVPKNPFNDLGNIRMVANGEVFPSDPMDGYGWIYQAATKTIRLNWSGTDSSDLRYFDY